MPQLVDLPTELLDTILELVLLHEQCPPASVDDARHNRLTPDPKPATRAWSTRHVVYGDSGTISNAGPLLRVSHQWNKQTAQLIRRLFPDGARYKLDVMFVDEVEFWPTWLHVPYLTEQVQSVEVTFRIFGKRKDRGSNFCLGDGAPPAVVWGYYFMLEHFLNYGPYPSTTNKSLEAQSRRRITVKAFDLLFRIGDPTCLPPTDSEESRTVWDRFQRTRRRRRNDPPATESIPFAIHPTWLAEHIQQYLNSLLGLSYHTSAWGMLLYGRVGQFRIVPPPGSRLDEVSFVLHESLGRSYVQPDDSSDEESILTTSTMGHLPGQCRLLTFWNWKWKTLEERREAGLGIPENVEWPSLDTWHRWRQAASKQHSDCDQARCLCLEVGLESWLQKQAAVEPVLER